MKPSKIKNTKILAVRDLTLQRLSRFASTKEADVEHCCLFRDDQFAGMRYRAGAFNASWLCDDFVVNIHRGSRLIDQISLESDQRRAA